ncbi:serine O-acetyltransferase EpsC [Croceicoccus sp. F390]|uniref:Serine acetyltransferase n=1 Tax=Croceicoccus esteveae TaxID=3075597 RepID=A0ABU2ZHC1_9SPHN|nr:serine O-acetyltransferase EpsC [Croceicoccus sp. F390]MDT0574817.1 serine O-acetyltransferase EpsC [Croceicoccus sp. F390]
MFDNLVAYLDSIRARDPAPRSRWEILIYPGVLALGLHRVAHWLFCGGLFLLARFVNHFSRFLTAIDIHPGAQIGRNLFIDHGFTVIGETAEIGDDVTIYQCVTLGGTNPTNGKPGKRHPTLLDGAIIGSGAQILGPVTIGRRARIGAAAVVTEDVPDGATMVGVKARSTLVPVETYQRPFMPYGTPCRDQAEAPACDRDMAARLTALEDELRLLRRQAAANPAATPDDAALRRRDEAGGA